MTFKDVIKNDLKSVFLNLGEFGEIHLLNGQEILVIIDENELTEREKRIRREEGGAAKKHFSFMWLREDFWPAPVSEPNFRCRWNQIYDHNAENEDGIYSISLEAVKS